MSLQESFLNKRCKAQHPERIDLGDGCEAVRNDVRAKELGISERSLNRDDAKGAPFLYVGNVKYRPCPEHPRWFAANKIQRRGQAPTRRRRIK